MVIIPIEIIKLEDNSFHLMIDVKINNIKSNLIIDTGASRTVFDINQIEDVCTDVNIVDEQDSSGINALISETKVGYLSKIIFGDLVIENYQCVLLDLAHINSIYKKYTDKNIMGLLGGDFLVKYKAVINYRQKTLKLYS